MRLKKLMSLVLACAMALSLVTVASAQDTEVYYIENFDYADINAFNAGKTATTSWGESGDGFPSNTAMVNAVTAASSTVNGIYNTTGHNVQPNPTLENGKISLYGASPAAHSSGSGSLTFVPNKIWDYVANDGYTYVISYDRSWNKLRNTAAVPNNNAVSAGRVWWLDSEKTAAQYGPIFHTKLTFTDGVAGVIHGTARPDAPNDDRYRHSMGAITVGEEYRYAVGIKKGSTSGDYYIASLAYARDGQKTTLDASFEKTLYSANQTKTNIGGFSFHDSYASNSTIDNVKMYTIKNDSFKATTTASEGKVGLSNKAITVNFGNLVAADTYDKTTVVVTKGEGEDAETLTYGEDYTVSDLNDVIGNVGGEIYSTATVTFAVLEEDTTYSIKFLETVANEIGTTLGGNNKVTFTTKAPDVKIMPLAVVGAESLVANGELQAVKAQLINTTSVPKNVALIYAVYTTTGQLADVAYVNDSVVETAEYEVGLKLTAEGTLKAFAWDGTTSLKPYTAERKLTIAAPAAAE